MNLLTIAGVIVLVLFVVVVGLAIAPLIMIGRRAPELRADMEEIHQGGKAQP
jgi:hypothetical protein